MSGLESFIAAGQRIDRYVVEDLLGGGGYGVVARARHVVLGTPVALKVLRPELASDPTVVERFFREARVAAELGSPHIVSVIDCGFAPEGHPFIAMEALVGESLAAALRRGPTSEALGRVILAQLLDALSAAHARGIVHRDVKPENVFLADDEGELRVVLLDFGIARIHSLASSLPSLTASGDILGTVGFLAPEQLDGRDVDARADVFAVGALAYEMLSGVAPFDERTFDDYVRSVRRPVVPLRERMPSISLELARVVERALARDPDARFVDASAMLLAVHGRLDEPLASTSPRPSSPQAAPRASDVGLELAATHLERPRAAVWSADTIAASVDSRPFEPTLAATSPRASMGNEPTLAAPTLGAARAVSTPMLAATRMAPAVSLDDVTAASSVGATRTTPAQPPVEAPVEAPATPADDVRIWIVVASVVGLIALVAFAMGALAFFAWLALHR